MTRDKWLEQLNNYGYAIGIDYKEAQALPLIAEYDRLTALNAQLLETLKAIETDEEGYCFWCNGYTKINGEVDHLSSCQLQAAIRAAEEEP